MSGIQEIWQPGYPVDNDDLQRMADAAAKGGDDELARIVSTPGDFGGVIPLLYQDNAVDSPILVVPGAAGRVNINKPATVFKRKSTAFPGRMDLAQVVEASNSWPQIATNSSGVPRTDCVYVQLTRATNTTGSRKFKDPTSGAITTQVLPLATVCTATILINQGSATPPADSGTAFNVPLATVTLADGYTLGTVLQQAWITQTWQRASLVHSLAPKYDNANFGVIDGHLDLSGTNHSQRNGAGLKIGVGFKLKASAPSGGGTYNFTLDDRHDWRSRFLWGQVCELNALDTPIHSQTNPTTPALSADKIWPLGYSGTNTGAGAFITLAMGLTLVSIRLRLGIDGKLEMQVVTEASYVGGNDHYYFVEVHASHPMTAG